MRLETMLANVSRICARDISRRALGTTERKRDLPSARMSASSGATTVVLPAPMIIWRMEHRPLLTSSTSSRTMSTCFFRSSKFHKNSQTRKRGSKRRSSPSRSTKCRPAAKLSAKCSPAWTSLGRRELAASACTGLFNSLSSVITAPMAREAWPTRFARRSVSVTSLRRRWLWSCAKKGFKRRTSCAPSDDSSAPNSSSGQISATSPARRRRENSVLGRRSTNPPAPTETWFAATRRRATASSTAVASCSLRSCSAGISCVSTRSRMLAICCAASALPWQ
mmetsp:Transcript_24243/g.49088  ORF Transcript_24243/g.49088 Transcript_24243/m.49088 type:complete len:280 (-) Transcript_24243:552-1391(-)